MNEYQDQEVWFEVRGDEFTPTFDTRREAEGYVNGLAEGQLKIVRVYGRDER